MQHRNDPSLLQRPLARASIALVLLVIVGAGVIAQQRRHGDGSGGVVSRDGRPSPSSSAVADPDTGRATAARRPSANPRPISSCGALTARR